MNKDKMLIIGCSNSKQLTRKIANNLNVAHSDLTAKHFPDGELYVKFETNPKNKEVVLVQSFYPANEAILEVLLAAYTAKDLGAKKLKLVAPYLAYIRQDKRFTPGEAISSKIIGKLFDVFDEIITIDPHLHRFKSLKEVFHTQTKKLISNKLIEEFILKNFKNPVIIGPDEESYQWAKEIALEIKAQAAILKKRRLSPRKVKITIKSPVGIKNKDIVIIDDILSTGKTVLETINYIKKQDPKTINVIAIHGIFADKVTYNKIKKNTSMIITTNTIENMHSKIDVSRLIADSLKTKTKDI
ncbi:ribose-phosphate diphosphokinase [Candidatus Woesearchaeota archaeon]|nr:ribose-phosphate diphosphokinase [Candidatus Woesearchaeota archaeon]